MSDAGDIAILELTYRDAPRLVHIMPSSDKDTRGRPPGSKYDVAGMNADLASGSKTLHAISRDSGSDPTYIKKMVRDFRKAAGLPQLPDPARAKRRYHPKLPDAKLSPRIRKLIPRIVALRHKYSATKIAQKLCISHTTVIRIIKKLGDDNNGIS
jgi:hypothetical protein